MTFDEIQHFRVSPIHLSVMVINVADDNTCFILENSYGRISTTGDPIHLMFGSRVWFLGSADRMVLFPVRSNGGHEIGATLISEGMVVPTV